MFWLSTYKISAVIAFIIGEISVIVLGIIAVADIISSETVNWGSVAIAILIVLVYGFLMWFAFTIANSIAFTMENIAAIKDDLYKIEKETRPLNKGN